MAAHEKCFRTNPFPCRFCQKWLETEEIRNVHEMSHNLTSCTICLFNIEKEKFDNHVLECRKKNENPTEPFPHPQPSTSELFPYLCHYCPSVFQTEEQQSVHVQNHADLCCSICNEWLKISRYDHRYQNCKTKQEKSRKKPKIPDNEVIFCPFCQIESSDPESLQDHIDSKHQEETLDSASTELKKQTEAKKLELSTTIIEQNLKVSEFKKSGIGKPKPPKTTKTPKWKEEIKQLKEDNKLLNNMYDTSEATNSKERTDSEKKLNAAHKINEIEQKNLKDQISFLNAECEKIKGELKKEKAKNSRTKSEEPTKLESKAVQVESKSSEKISDDEHVQSEAILENSPPKAILEKSQSNEPLIHYKCQLCKFETLETADLVSHMVTGHKVDETQSDWNKYISKCKRVVTIPRNTTNFDKSKTTTDTKQDVSIKIVVKETKLTSQKPDQPSINKDEAKTKEKSTSDGNSMEASNSVQLETIQGASLPLECSECSKTFQQKWMLKRHIETVHEGKKPFQCNHCQKKFSQKPAMEKHVASVHEGKKELKCKECEKYFSQSSNMKSHMAAVHEKKKPYTCEICDAKFPNNQSLSNHKAHKHSNEKPYTCSLCNKSFSLAKGLNRHKIKCTLKKEVHEKKKIL